MSEGQSIERVIEKIAVAYTNAGTEWVRIEEIVKTTGITTGEMAAAILELLKTDETFQAEQEPFGHRITEWNRANPVIIGGEPRHLISWE